MKPQSEAPMKERPILFSAPMVRALLEGRKTVTRRIVSQRLIAKHPIPNDAGVWNHNGLALWLVDERGGQATWPLPCPFGRAGDRLWVRETWMENHSGPEINGHGQPLYRASWGNTPEGQHWKPSIFMPRWASRLSLEITGLKVERLQDITEEEAKSEGVHVGSRAVYPMFSDSRISPCLNCGKPHSAHVGSVHCCPGGHGESFSRLSYKGGFAHLWESINGAGSWAANPWVWAVSFKTAKPA